MMQVDMSSEALTSRLRQVSELRDLCLALMKAKRLQGEKLRTESVKDAGLDIDKVISTEQPDERGENN
jgi:hypothetical protein